MLRIKNFKWLIAFVTASFIINTSIYPTIAYAGGFKFGIISVVKDKIEELKEKKAASISKKPKNPEKIEVRTDINGEVFFHSSYLEKEVHVTVKDDNDDPVNDILIVFLTDGTKIVCASFDPTGYYLPSINSAVIGSTAFSSQQKVNQTQNFGIEIEDIINIIVRLIKSAVVKFVLKLPPLVGILLSIIDEIPLGGAPEIINLEELIDLCAKKGGLIGICTQGKEVASVSVAKNSDKIEINKKLLEILESVNVFPNTDLVVCVKHCKLTEEGLYIFNISVTLTSVRKVTSIAGDQKIELSWEENPGDQFFKGFIVMWGTHSGEYTDSLDVGNVTNHTITGLQNGMTYYVTVVAYDLYGEQTKPYLEKTAFPTGGEVLTNIALNKPTTASGVWYDDPITGEDDLPEKAIDGNMNTRWNNDGFNNPTTSWWQVDLEQSYEVEKIIIRWYGISATNFKLQYWDGDSWEIILDFDTGTTSPEMYSGDAGINTFEFSPISTNKVRFYSDSLYTDFSGNNTITFWEFEAYADVE